MTVRALPDITVVVPARNASEQLPDCLASIIASQPAEIIVVDGLSSDTTREIGGSMGARVLSDEGRGLPAARAIGAAAATTEFVALIDADVVVPDGALAALFDEFLAGGYGALQAGLASESGPGYWGRALTYHHRTGRSRGWFGLVATIFPRDLLLEHGFDAKFASGEDIELRWRLQRAGIRVGVSERVFVRHRFGDTWTFARGQFDADGRGLALMVRKHKLRGIGLFFLPLAAAVRGSAQALARLQPQWLPYYAAFAVFNYRALLPTLIRRPR